MRIIPRSRSVPAIIGSLTSPCNHSRRACSRKIMAVMMGNIMPIGMKMTRRHLLYLIIPVLRWFVVRCRCTRARSRLKSRSRMSRDKVRRWQFNMRRTITMTYDLKINSNEIMIEDISLQLTFDFFVMRESDAFKLSASDSSC